MVTITTSRLHPSPYNRGASGLFNLTRTGWAVGLAIINTVMNDRMAFIWRVCMMPSSGRPVAESTLDNMTTALRLWVRMQGQQPFHSLPALFAVRP